MHDRFGLLAQELDRCITRFGNVSIQFASALLSWPWGARRASPRKASHVKSVFTPLSFTAQALGVVAHFVNGKTRAEMQLAESNWAYQFHKARFARLKQRGVDAGLAGGRRRYRGFG